MLKKASSLLPLIKFMNTFKPQKIGFPFDPNLTLPLILVKSQTKSKDRKPTKTEANIKKLLEIVCGCGN
jgi:hypothetical protein